MWRTIEEIKLSSREKEIIYYSTRGFRISEIADALFVAVDTVKFHRSKIFHKLRVKSITEAIACATNNKLL